MARRKLEQKNVRSLIKTSGGKSYAVTIPVDIIRRWGWQKRQKVTLKTDERRKRIIIEDWKSRQQARLAQRAGAAKKKRK